MKQTHRQAGPRALDTSTASPCTAPHSALLPGAPLLADGLTTLMLLHGGPHPKATGGLSVQLCLLQLCP
jgi:hypothetical protein